MIRVLRSEEVVPVRPVSIFLDHPGSGAQSLDAAMRLATDTGRGLLVFLSDEAAEAHPDLGRRLEALGPRRWAIQRVFDRDLAAVFAGVRRFAPVVLIVSAGSAGFEESRIDALQRELSCPLVLLRDD